MRSGEILRTLVVALLVITLWGIYFAVSAAPKGASFIYADF
jgi:hypothetical protein